MPSTKKSRLVEFLKQQENAALAAGDPDMLRHASPEGGTDTIGYGHKLTEAELKSGKVYGIPLSTLTVEQAERILEQDIKVHRARLDKELRQTYGIGLNTLDQRRQDMLLDYQFNLGSAVKKFPSFTEAVVTEDWDRAKDEMTRYFTDPEGNTRPLARNRHFYDTFMSKEAEKAYQKPEEPLPAWVREGLQ